MISIKTQLYESLSQQTPSHTERSEQLYRLVHLRTPHGSESRLSLTGPDPYVETSPIPQNIVFGIDCRSLEPRVEITGQTKNTREKSCKHFPHAEARGLLTSARVVYPRSEYRVTSSIDETTSNSPARLLGTRTTPSIDASQARQPVSLVHHSRR